MTGSNAVHIGDFDSGAGLYLWTGSFDQLTIWNRALTSADVASLHAAPYQMIAPPIPSTIFYSIRDNPKPGLPIPRALPAATPLVSVKLNAAWIPYVRGALFGLLSPNVWAGENDVANEATADQVQELMAQFDTTTPVP